MCSTSAAELYEFSRVARWRSPSPSAEVERRVQGPGAGAMWNFPSEKCCSNSISYLERNEFDVRLPASDLARCRDRAGGSRRVVPASTRSRGVFGFDTRADIRI